MRVTIRIEKTYELKPAAITEAISAADLFRNINGETNLVKGKISADLFQKQPEIMEIVRSGKRICFPDDDGFHKIWVLRWFNGEVFLARRGSATDRFDSNDLLVYDLVR